METKGTIYIAGPMSGHYGFNFHLFDRAELDLIEHGWKVINPARMDRDLGFDPYRDKVDAEFLHAAMIRDTDAIIHHADAVAMLPDWEKSTGAKAEMALAFWKHIPVYQWPDGTLIEKPVPGAAIHTSPLSGKTASERKASPVASGVLDYFPDAIVAVAQCSYAGNEQHNPGQPLHWDRSKSTDEADCLIRHFMERGTIDTDGIRHSAKAAWRALALLQKEIEGTVT